MTNRSVLSDASVVTMRETIMPIGFHRLSKHVQGHEVSYDAACLGASPHRAASVWPRREVGYAARSHNRTGRGMRYSRNGWSTCSIGAGKCLGVRILDTTSAVRLRLRRGRDSGRERHREPGRSWADHSTKSHVGRWYQIRHGLGRSPICQMGLDKSMSRLIACCV